MRPTVILDAAFLGHEGQGHRGAERVARHLFEGLLVSPSCHLTCVATSHLAGVYDFLKAQHVEKLLRFDSGQLQRSRTARSLSRTIHDSLANRSFPARASRRALASVVSLYQRGESALSPAWLADGQIYHSPHTPFPTAVQENTRLRKFLTCHDFIPLKNPQYFPRGTNHFMDAVLMSLQPQNFAFCVSEATRNDLLNFSAMPPERVFVTPLAADPEIFHPVDDSVSLVATRRRYSLGEGPYFLALSAHDPHKNFVHLVECFGALIETGEMREGNLVIVGANPSRNPAVQAAILRFPKAAARILVLGFVPDEDLAAIYSGALAFLFPSLAEGFGIPPLEAMQCGVPVIASNADSIPEVVGDAGVLLSPTDQDGWRSAMLRVSREPSWRAELIKRSQSRAALFSWSRFISATLAGYRASLENF